MPKSKTKKAEIPPSPTLHNPVYTDGIITLYHGLAEQVIPLLPKSDLIVIDPREECPAWLVRMLINHGKRAIVLRANLYSELLFPDSTCWLTWENITGKKTETEMAWTNFKKPSRIVSAAASRLGFLQWCLQYFPPLPKLVIDPMAGNGTTGRACKDLGIPCILVESNSRNIDAIIKLLRQESLPLNSPPKPELEDAPLFPDDRTP